jgi:hypothetical protein
MDMMSSMVHDDKNRRICIEFPQNTHSCRVDDIKAVPETCWYSNEQYFSIHGLLRFKCFVRFCVTSRVLPRQPNYGTASEESTYFILVCDLAGVNNLRMSLYAETGLPSSLKPEGFIDPFKNIEQYGPLEDPFSLSVLSPGDREDLKVSVMHRDHRHDYVVSASLAMTQSPPFGVIISVGPPDDDRIDREEAPVGYGRDRPQGNDPPDTPGPRIRYHEMRSVAPHQQPRY